MSSPLSAIEIFDDEDTRMPDSSSSTLINDMSSQFSAIEIFDDEDTRTPDSSSTILLDDDDDEWHHEERPLSLSDDDDNPEDEDDLQCLGGSTIELRAVTLPRGSQPVASITRGGTTLRPRTVIEMDLDFFHIESLFQSPEGELFASGYTLVRNRYMNNYLQKKTNEVVLYAWLPNEYKDATLHQCQTIIALPTAWITRECVFTNLPFPWESYRTDAANVGSVNQAFAENHCHITCRRKVLHKAERSKVCELVIHNLTETEVKLLGGNPVLDRKQRESYIGQVRTKQRLRQHEQRIKQSCQSGNQPFLSEDAADAHVDTYGDICAGAGGTTRGAASAGLNLRFLLDNASKMVESLKRNFSGVDIREQDVSQFCRCQSDGSMPVDILHISFPCCAHSYLNRGGRNDQENIDVGYSIDPILKKTNPVVVTFEQVRGITTKHGGENYEDLIHQLTSCGFSVRARVVKMSDYGHPTRRARLIVFASCPGQSLPTIPEPTHGPGRRPLATIVETLSKLDYNSIPPHMQGYRPRSCLPYDPHCQMSNIFTSGGSLDPHFSGQRTWMLAEAAVLSSFPPWHQFFGGKTSIMKQIGNAVPPVAAEALFRHIRQHLQKTDAVFARKAGFVDLT